MLNVRMAFENKYGPVQSGITCNVSRSGLLVQFRPIAEIATPNVGDLMSVEMDLPAPSFKSPRFMSFSGSVSRVIRSDNGVVLIALDISRLRFRDVQEIGTNGNLGFEFESFLM